MAAGAWEIYDDFKLRIGDGTHDLDGHAFVVALYLSTSNAGTLSNSVLATLTNEVSGNGYARDTTNTITWTRSGATATFDITTDPQYTASGGSIVARRAVLYNDTPTSPADPLVATCLLDSAPADVTVTSGNTLTIVINALGVFTLT